MPDRFTYHDYVTDETFLSDYNTYQRQYAANIRESDRRFLEIIGETLERKPPAAADRRLLDIGCSTGNLLLHVKRAFPNLKLTGGDLAESSLAECMRNPELAGVEFRRLDICNLPRNVFDIVTVNAVLYMFDDLEYRKAMKNLCESATENGVVLIFDFAHEFTQDISITETTNSHPRGLRLRFRPYEAVREAAREAGFSSIEFHPFSLSVDLPKHPAGEPVTHTVRDESGNRIAFRGVLYQPWCHMIAVKDGAAI